MRSLSPPLLLVLFLLLGLLATPAAARRSGPGPAAPIWPPAGRTDRMLYEQALTMQRGMWQHISPEGLLVVRHRRGANGEDLSHDVLGESDAAMWTGCYAGAQACRWWVTRDPDALAQVRVLARGLAALSDVTGVAGAFGRNVGRPQGDGAAAGERLIASPSGSGLWFRPDVSRDQLAGVVFGWALIGRLMEDEELRELAARHLRAIAWRLWAHEMEVRDHAGRRVEYGELRPDVKWLPFVKNGGLAAIGLATLVGAADLNPQDGWFAQALERLERKGWADALPEQHTFLPGLINSSNVHMIALPLVVLALSPQREHRFAHRAKQGMRSLRAATVGWWNAGLCACWLMGGFPQGRAALRGELRATLHAMPAEEPARALVRAFHADRVAPIWERQISSWHWTNDVTWHHIWQPAPQPRPWVYWTGADWLFAYWLARAAGELEPIVGPGASPRTDPLAVELPAWHQTAPPR